MYQSCIPEKQATGNFFCHVKYSDAAKKIFKECIVIHTKFVRFPNFKHILAYKQHKETLTTMSKII